MIAGIEGSVVRRGADYVVLNVGGVHYKATVAPQTLAGLESDRVQLATYLYVREDALQLYGFASVEEEELFEEVLAVSGIGPKSALALVGSMAPSALRQAIQAGSVDVLKRVPGIGAKTAQRLILELKGKLAPGVAEIAPTGSPEAELAEALNALGYSPAETASAIGYLKGLDLPLEERLRRALRFFASSYADGEPPEP
ncbi:MAG TPA: Holliday junction branch migration protein RuvA [Chloroflexota bacterium]|nr:Holliday junction branch migration protein RuvA [Chloroflexota bacterium]